MASHTRGLMFKGLYLLELKGDKERCNLLCTILPDEEYVVEACGPVAGVDRVALRAGVVAGQLVPRRPRHHARRAERAVRTAAVPAAPAGRP